MGKRIIVAKRRKRERKTNYTKRIKLLKSGKHRLVVRKTNKYIITQIIKSIEARDRVIVGITSKKLKEFGWPYSFKSIPACYLTGLLLGKMAKEKNVKEAILDIGLARPIKGGRIFAIVYGISKFVSIPYSREALPSEERIYGKHMRGYIKDEVEKKVKELEEKIMKV